MSEKLGADENLLRRCALLLASGEPRDRGDLERKLGVALVFGPLREQEACARSARLAVDALSEGGDLRIDEKGLVSLAESGQSALLSHLRAADAQGEALAGQARRALEEGVDKPQARMFAERIGSLLRLLRRLEGRTDVGAEARMLGEVLRSRLRPAFVLPIERRVTRVRDIIDFFYTQAVILDHRQRAKGAPRHIHREHVQWKTVRRGVAAARVEMTLRSGPILAHLLRVDPKRVTLRAVDAREQPPERRGLLDLLRPHGALEGTSGGFFLYSETDIEAPQRRGDPVGLLVCDGEVRCPPLLARSALLVDEAGHVFVRRVSLRGTGVVWEGGRLLLRTVNRRRQNPADVIGYTRSFGAETPAGCGRTVTVVGGQVTAVGEDATSIPLLGLVIALPTDPIADEVFASLSGASRVTYEIAPQRGEGRIVQAMAGGPMLVDRGKIDIDLAGEDFRPGIPPVTFSDDATQGRNLLPRLAWGILPDHRLVAVAIDGRNVERSVGESLDGLARTMLSLGCELALNFDGGSSKRMAIDGEVVDLSSTAIVEGRGPGGPQRPLSSAWAIVPK